MDWPQIVTLLLGSSVVSVIGKAVFDQWNLSRTTKAAERRREIDRAASAERESRILKESLAVHRRIIIDAPCLGPADLPQWPSTSAHNTKENT